jgi:hypothetical protein
MFAFNKKTGKLPGEESRYSNELKMVNARGAIKHRAGGLPAWNA